ncbi:MULTISPECIES: DUF2524 family protein [Bacillaceae]|uniref:YtzC family protein n=1 Tax=Evansella alkalicola TaxID=745819 RepID=A0ABS6K2B1_9BACI|nr:MULTISPECIES: DUF2524 family protein [Bacillaceae]MBU9723897.1 YtzC family protein [Bacillus alkalicola]
MTNSNYLQGAVQEIEHIMSNAEEQLNDSKRIQPGDAEAFTQAQVQLEQANMELEKMLLSSNAEQRDQLTRLQQQVHQLQNRMILGL